MRSTAEILGHRVRLARKFRCMTQAELSQQAGVGISTLACIESGDAGVALQNFLKVIQALGLLSQVDELLNPQRDPEAAAFAERALKGK